MFQYEKSLSMKMKNLLLSVVNIAFSRPGYAFGQIEFCFTKISLYLNYEQKLMKVTKKLSVQFFLNIYLFSFF